MENRQEWIDAGRQYALDNQDRDDSELRGVAFDLAGGDECLADLVAEGIEQVISERSKR